MAKISQTLFISFNPVVNAQGYGSYEEKVLRCFDLNSILKFNVSIGPNLFLGELCIGLDKSIFIVSLHSIPGAGRGRPVVGPFSITIIPTHLFCASYLGLHQTESEKVIFH